MKCNIIVLIIHNISYIYSYFSKVVTETIVNCAIWALKGIMIVLNKFSILAASWGYF